MLLTEKIYSQCRFQTPLARTLSLKKKPYKLADGMFLLINLRYASVQKSTVAPNYKICNSLIFYYGCVTSAI